MRLCHDLASRACRMMFVVLMTVAWCGGPRSVAAAQQAGDNPSAPSPERINAAADQVERLYRAADALAAELPRDTFDPAAVVESVGKDPAALLAWVRDHTTFVPYRGALRGPAGTLMDRLGNSLDRSLLLAELLRLAGHDVRLARAELDEAAARDVLAKARGMASQSPASQPTFDERALNDSLEKLAAQFQIDPAILQESSKASAAQAAALEERATTRGREQSAELAKLIGAPAGAPADDGAATAASEHWWVQHRVGGKWIDLDAHLPDAQPGRSLAAAAPKQTINYRPKQGKLPLPAELCHEVDVRVVIEQSSKSGPREHTVLTYTLRPAELGGRSVLLAHVPLNRPMTAQTPAELSSPQQLRDEVLKHDEWMPTLVLGGGATFAQASFTAAGDVRRSPNVSALGGSRRAVKKASGLFDTLPGGGADASPKPGTSQLTAEWIEYVIRSPGAEPRTIRREVFDFVGPAARAAAADSRSRPPLEPLPEPKLLERALALMGQTEILALSARMSPAFVAHLEAEAHRANARVVPATLRRFASGEESAAEPPRQLDELRPMPGPLYLFACARDAWSPVREDVYLDRPNVFTYRSELRSREDADTDTGLVAYHGIDIVANEVAVRRGAADAFAMRLTQGVVDTNAEALVMSPPPVPGHEGHGDHAPAGAVENTAEAFAARGEGAWVVLRSADDPARAKLSLPDDLAAALDRDLRAGYAVVVPPQPTDAHGRSGLVWWRVDPIAGHVLGVNHRGMGIAFTETQLLALRVSFQIGAGLICIYGVNHSSWGSAGRGFGTLACVVATFTAGAGTIGTRVGMTAIEASRFSAVGGGIGFALALIRTLVP